MAFQARERLSVTFPFWISSRGISRCSHTDSTHRLAPLIDSSDDGCLVGLPGFFQLVAIANQDPWYTSKQGFERLTHNLLFAGNCYADAMAIPNDRAICLASWDTVCSMLGYLLMNPDNILQASDVE